MSESLTETPNTHAHLRALAKQWLAEREGQLSPPTVSNYAQTVKYILDQLEGKPITYDTVTNLFIEWSRSGRLARSNHRSRTEFGIFLKWLKKRNVIDWQLDNKSVFPIGPSSRKPITEEDYLKLLNMIKHNQKRFGHLEYAIMTGWETGLRLNDMCHLTWANIDLEAKALKVFPRKTRRFQKLVELPLSKEYVEYLKTLNAVRDPNSPYISPDMAYSYEKNNSGVLRRHLDLLFRYAQIDVAKSFHCFRTGWITRMSAKGMNMGLIANCLAVGLEHVMAYCKPTLEDKRKAIEA